MLSEAAEFFKKKYGLHPAATNIAMPGGNLKIMGLDFQMCKPMQKEEIRKILLEMSEEFLEMINNDSKMKVFFSQLPLSIENIDLGIFF